jgi:hypothetical protein
VGFVRIIQDLICRTAKGGESLSPKAIARRQNQSPDHRGFAMMILFFFLALFYFLFCK